MPDCGFGGLKLGRGNEYADGPKMPGRSDAGPLLLGGGRVGIPGMPGCDCGGPKLGTGAEYTADGPKEPSRPDCGGGLKLGRGCEYNPDGPNGPGASDADTFGMFDGGDGT